MTLATDLAQRILETRYGTPIAQSLSSRPILRRPLLARTRLRQPVGSVRAP